MMTLMPTNNRRTVLFYGALMLDIVNERAAIGSVALELRQSDWAILSRLAQAGGSYVSSGDLLAEIWGEDMRDDAAFLRSWIYQLNDRLGTSTSGRQIIEAIPGGYRLVSPDEWHSDYRRAC